MQRICKLALAHRDHIHPIEALEVTTEGEYRVTQCLNAFLLRVVRLPKRLRELEARHWQEGANWAKFNRPTRKKRGPAHQLVPACEFRNAHAGVPLHHRSDILAHKTSCA